MSEFRGKRAELNAYDDAVVKELNCFEDDVPAHRKKSKKKGQPRADHKHIYETVNTLIFSLFSYFKSYLFRHFIYKFPTKLFNYIPFGIKP